MNHRWTVERDVVLTQAWLDGVSPEDIAGRLNLTPTLVIARAETLKLASVHRRGGGKNKQFHYQTAAPTSISQCRYIAGDPVTLIRAGEKPFCGRRTRLGSSFCDEHHALCHRPVDALEIEAIVAAPTRRLKR